MDRDTWPAAATSTGTRVCKNHGSCMVTRVQGLLMGTAELPGGPGHTRVQELPRVISPCPAGAGTGGCCPGNGGGQPALPVPVPGRCQLGWALAGSRIGPEPPVPGAVPMDARGVGARDAVAGMLSPQARAVLVPVPVGIHGTGSVSGSESHRGVARDTGAGGCWRYRGCRTGAWPLLPVPVPLDAGGTGRWAVTRLGTGPYGRAGAGGCRCRPPRVNGSR